LNIHKIFAAGCWTTNNQPIK